MRKMAVKQVWCVHARRGAKVLENRITADEERIKQLEKELEMTIVFGEEADRKYEEVSRENNRNLLYIYCIFTARRYA